MKINYKITKLHKFLFYILVILIILPSTVFISSTSWMYFKNKTGSVLKIKNVVFEFEDIYSDKISNEIRAFILAFVDKLDNFVTFDQGKFYDRLKNKFNIIKSFECRSDNQLTLNVKITGQKPFCFINKDQILSIDNDLLSSNLFEKLDLSELPNINIKSVEQEVNDDYLSIEICEFVRKITKYHWESFDLDYVKSSEIRLYPKNSEFNCILLSNMNTFFDQAKICKALQLYEKIVHDVQIQKKLKHTKNKQLVLDFRFKNSIVARVQDLKEGGI